jgi:N-acyl-D-amino-acid deacylase
MREGALGLSTALIYVPDTFATTDELIALCGVAARHGGLFSAHMRNEGNHLEAAVDEMLDIAERADIRVEIYHLKQAGKRNWHKLDAVIGKIEAARARGLRVGADMYTYEAAATGLDAAMPPWVREGGVEAWIARLRDPAVRARVAAEMREPETAWENFFALAGPDGIRLSSFKTEALKPLQGQSLAAVAAARGTSPEDTAMDLVIEDGTRVEVLYFLMSEDSVRRQIQLPWVSFGSDSGAIAPVEPFTRSRPHPRAYGNFARLLGKYVRDEKLITLGEAVRKLTSLPASVLGLADRGRLAPGFVADIAVFDPAAVRDNATYAEPHQFSTGVAHVLVGGTAVLRDGEHTGATPGRIVRRPA